MLIYGELQSATLENLASDPPGNVAGRIWNNTTEVKVKIDDGALKRALLKNDQHLVIGNSATASQNTRLHRGAANLLQFVKADDVTAEGTPSTSLTQVSARMENYTDAGLPAFGNIGRLAYITDTTSFAFDNGSAWDKIRLLRPQIAQAVLSKTAAYAAAVGDGVSFNDASGAAYAISLPAASASNNGEELVFKKTDSTFNAVTITGVTTLNTQNESVVVISNASAWVVKERVIPSFWFAATFAVTGGLASTGPSQQSSFVKRVGDSLWCRPSFTLGNTAAGTGTVTLPSGIALDTAKNSSAQSVLGTWVNNHLNNAFGNTSRIGPVAITHASPSDVWLGYSGSGGSITQLGAVTATNSVITGGDGISLDFLIPVSGWNS